MNTKTQTIAYIDGANLHKGVESSAWKLDYKKFRSWIRQKRETRSVILVSSDGDYTPLVKFWMEKGVHCTIVSPAPIRKCSILLKKTGAPIVYLEEVKHKLSYA